MNPLRSGLVERATDYGWSSARAHVEGIDAAGLLATDLWREIVPLDDWGDVLAERETAEEEWRRRFRAATYAGKPLGSRQLVRRLEGDAGFSLVLRGPGRPPRRARTGMARAVGEAS